MLLKLDKTTPSTLGLSTFAEQGSVSIDRFLEDSSARRLLEEVESRSDWVEVFAATGKTYEIPTAEFERMATEQKDKILRLSYEAALKALQYRYRTVRISEDPAEREKRQDLIDGFADLMNSEEALSFLRRITGLSNIAFADAQATCYRAGDFLTNHDDAVEGKNRLAAYVYSLTPEWSFDWGGLLLIEQENRISGYVPAFNSLRVFRVPQDHCVSIVAPWVTASRYSITGWLRAKS